MIPAFPKIFALGSANVLDILDGPVELSEKLDGSQIGFGRVDGELIIRSKGRLIDRHNVDKLFLEGVEYIESIEEKLPNNTVLFGEYFKKPRHNSLKYDRIPKNHIALFGAMRTDINETRSFDDNLYREFAYSLDLEPIPVLYSGVVTDMGRFEKLLESTSVLGGTKIEGVVVKNYAKHVDYYGGPIPIMCAKFVSEKFKEVNQKVWKLKSSGGGFEAFKEGFRTEARWLKAVQTMRDAGTLLRDPKDIGLLMQTVRQDIIDEETDNIRSYLWNTFGHDLLKHSTRGLPEWYKKWLVEQAMGPDIPDEVA